MICPACKGDMIVVEYQRIEMDFCPKCHGAWFDSGELALLLDSANLTEPDQIQNVSQLPEIRVAEQKRKCPICRQRMGKASIGEKPPVLVDICRRGDGLFFDGGEINHLVKQMPVKEPGKPGSGQPVVNFLEEVFQASD